jgi:sorbitol-specific phosphotransferase system component IIBC
MEKLLYFIAFLCFYQSWASILFLSPKIANPQILGLILLSQIRKFLRCVNPQIANPQIFMINPQISLGFMSKAGLFLNAIPKDFCQRAYSLLLHCAVGCTVQYCHLWGSELLEKS